MNSPQWLKRKLFNKIQSALLVGGMGTLLGSLGWLIGGDFLATIALSVIAATYFLNPMVSPRLILNMYRGRKIGHYEAPQLYRVLHVLAERADLPRTPLLYYLPSDVMNAFTVGTRESAAIAISDGLLRRLSLREIAGVLAHEVSHIAHNDTRVMGFADLSSRMTSLLSFFGQILLLLNLPLIVFGGYTISWTAILLLIFAPTVSGLLQLALSRTREYDADLGSAKLLGDPEPLASALSKMEQFQGIVLERLIWPTQRLPEPSLLRTHPPTQERIRRLLALKSAPFAVSARTAIPFETRQAPLGLIAQVPHPPRWHINGLWY
jgi:heat shock protein HtpX